jgi:hypothetical protein
VHFRKWGALSVPRLLVDCWSKGEGEAGFWAKCLKSLRSLGESNPCFSLERAKSIRWMIIMKRVRDGDLRMSIPARLHEQALLHQFWTRNDPTEAQRMRSELNKQTAKSTKPIVIPPLITVGSRVERFPNREPNQKCCGSED